MKTVLIWKCKLRQRASRSVSEALPGKALKLVLVFLGIITIGLTKFALLGEAAKKQGEYIITYSGAPDSFDPLDFDKANNVNIARCMYATPLEFNRKGELVSSILAKFGYNPSSKKITFVLKKDLLFSDGSRVTGNDLVISLKRMLLVRPNFPVISQIKGLARWLIQAHPLKTIPSGITINGDQIEIEFSEPVEQPLFRFTLELFSIIPEKCVDLENNKLLCPKPPESGRYETAQTVIGQANYDLTLRPPFKGTLDIVEKLRLTYDNLESALVKYKSDIITKRVITSTGEIFFRKGLDRINDFYVQTTPLTWHFRLKINVQRASLADLSVRRYIIDSIRAEIRANCPKMAVCDESIFSKLVPGYIDFQSDEERKSRLDNHSDILSTIAKLPKTIIWITSKSKNDILEDAINTFCKKHSISCRALMQGSPEANNAINSSAYDFVVNGTGFWSLDPFGDIKMLFTPKLHKVLGDMAEDGILQSMIANLNSLEFANKADEARRLNKYIHDQYIYNVFAHFSFAFLSNSDGFAEALIPQSGNLPAPWMFF